MEHTGKLDRAVGFVISMPATRTELLEGYFLLAIETWIHNTGGSENGGPPNHLIIQAILMREMQWHLMVKWGNRANVEKHPLWPQLTPKNLVKDPRWDFSFEMAGLGPTSL